MSATGKQWKLNPAEVVESGCGGTVGSRQRATRAGRASTVTAAGIKLTHSPTGLNVAGEVPSGNYSRTQMQEHKMQLYSALFQELEEKVAKHLRIPGR